MLATKSASSGFGLFTAAASPSATRSERWLQEQLKRARRQGPFTITVELTPELAELLLRSNPANRNVSQYKVTTYARDVSEGRWAHNGETIIVADSGELNDGQHRCLAVIEAGRAIVTEISFGVSRETRSTVDIGMKRTVGQHLAMTGALDANTVAHAAALLLTYERSQRFQQLTMQSRPTPSEVFEWAQTHYLDDDVRVGRNTANKIPGGAGLYAALHFVLSKISVSDASRFFELLKTGADLGKNDPIYKLRERLRDDKRQKRLKSPAIAAMTIIAWNAWRKRRGIKSLEVKSGDSFPIPE